MDLLFVQLIIPIHMPKHRALAVMDVKKQTVEYLDPAQREGVYFYAPNKDFAKTVLADLVSHT